MCVPRMMGGEQGERVGRGIVRPVDKGRVTLCVCVWREWGAWRIPQPTPPKNAVAQGGAAGVARPPCRGMPFQYAKIVQMSAEYAKLA